MNTSSPKYKLLSVALNKHDKEVIIPSKCKTLDDCFRFWDGTLYFFYNFSILINGKAAESTTMSSLEIGDWCPECGSDWNDNYMCSNSSKHNGGVE